MGDCLIPLFSDEYTDVPTFQSTVGLQYFSSRVGQAAGQIATYSA